MTIGRLITILVVVGIIGGVGWYFLGDKAGEIADNAREAANDPFVKAGTAYSSADYEGAAQQYTDWVAENKDKEDVDQQRLADAMYRIGASWDSVGEGKKAATAMQAFVKKFPDDKRVQEANKVIELHR